MVCKFPIKYVFVIKPYNREILGKLRLCGDGGDSGYVSTHGACGDGSKA
ncbi:hypothetical protein [Hathewaya limosa]|nr:hypothetical protein [Hathewaya limosa]